MARAVRVHRKALQGQQHHISKQHVVPPAWLLNLRLVPPVTSKYALTVCHGHERADVQSWLGSCSVSIVHTCAAGVSAGFQRPRMLLAGCKMLSQCPGSIGQYARGLCTFDVHVPARDQQ